MRYLLLYLLCGIGLSTAAQQKTKFSASDYVHTLKKVTDVMVNDVASPVAASRYYAYIALAANEVQANCFPGKQYSFAHKLNDFQGINASEQLVLEADASLSTVLVVLKMGEKLLPSGYLLQHPMDSLLLVAQRKGIAKTRIDASIQLAEHTVQQMLPYMGRDGFSRLNAMPRYTPKDGDAWWQPTPPVFMPALEPHWRRVRTFALDSAQQFKPLPPSEYDTSKAAPFYLQMKETYEVVNRANKAEQAIAQFWDCNPFAVQQIGHVQFGLKKISPGGHWMGITGISCLKRKCNFSQTVLAHAFVGLALADAFIACWDEKYRSNRVRPETAIHRLMDPRWKPLLQTPPFPEYVSGHSVASSAAAEVLTRLFGDSFSFKDNTEIEFELPVRSFTSFRAAAAEASISRLYGGIHFRDAIEQGAWLGQKVGQKVVDRLEVLRIKG